ncbi:MAG: aldehyde dehydrogenase family protein [Thermoflexales bacterium]|nr:aldehyde dehydrogenase family protein [Thermoflexales bacterium]
MPTAQSILQHLGIRETNYGACAGGDWIHEQEGVVLVSVNPATNLPLARVIQATPAGYDAVVRRAQVTFLEWRERSAQKRSALVRDLSAVLREHQEPLGDLIALEVGKVRAEAHAEVQALLSICDLAAELAHRIHGATLPTDHPHYRLLEQWHPLGVVGVITAFDLPLAMWGWHALIAAVCGDTVVWNPSPLAPLCAIAVQHICNRVAADHDALGVLNLFIGAEENIDKAMLTDPRLPLICFAGSPQVGKRVAQHTGERLARALLTLSGNNAIVVHEDADLDLASRAITAAAIASAGQRFNSARRLIAHHRVKSALLERLLRAYADAHACLGDPLAEGTRVGPLAAPRHVEGFLAAVAQAKAEGGKVLIGGKIRSELGPNFVEPTIIEMPWQTPVVRREVAAPILYVVEYDTLDRAIALVNEVPGGFSAAIFTNSLSVSERFIGSSGCESSIARVNLGTSDSEVSHLLAGELGSAGDAWKHYMRRQTCAINSSGAPMHM